MMRARYKLFGALGVAAAAGLLWFALSSKKPMSADNITPESTSPTHVSRQEDRAEPSAPPSPSPDVLCVVGKGADRSLTARSRALERLGEDMADMDAETLKEFLLHARREPTLDDHQYHLLVQRIMASLRSQNDSSGLWPCLIQLASGDRYSMIVRDYATQHLGIWYQDQDRIPEVEAFLWSVLESPDSAFFGTAAMAVWPFLSREQPRFDTSRLAQAALMRLRSTAASDAPDINAVWLCAKLNVSEALPLIRPWAASSRPAIALPAIHAVGALGARDDLPALRRLAVTSDPAVQNVINKAISNIENRELDKSEG